MRAKSVIVWCVLLVGSLLGQAAATTDALRPSRAEVEQAVIDSIPVWQGHRATVLKYLDLTQRFQTSSPWALVVAQDPHPQQQDVSFDPRNPIVICLVNTLTPHCTEFQQCGITTSGDPPWYASWFRNSCEPARIFGVAGVKVVYTGARNTHPLLLVKTADMGGGNGSHNVRATLYRYARSTNRFRSVFTHDSGGANNNQAARFVEHGPLQGDVIVDYPTGHPPYAYWVEVFAPHGNGKYRRILRYRSITHYGDGNPLAVADSEMPEIMKRLGFWKPGDALPMPPHAPKDCGPLIMRHGEEWCKTLRIATTPQ